MTVYQIKRWFIIQVRWLKSTALFFLRKRSGVLDYILLRKEMVDEQVSNLCICSDPMNGCPEDFAEDSSRKVNRLEARACGVEPHSKWMLGIIDQVMSWYKEQQYNQQYYSLPWNQ